jgi:CMP/dCMP kinase
VIRRVVAIGGPPGSGKSTAGRLVADRLGLTYTAAGDVFRAEARRQGMDVEAFGRYAEEHPEVDTTLDRTMQSLATPGRLLDGRIQGALCRQNGVPVHYLVVTASEEERARRVAGRDGQSVDEARRRIAEREASERKRYRARYGIDLASELPDLTIDSTHLDANSVAERIVSFVRSREPEAPA